MHRSKKSSEIDRQSSNQGSPQAICVRGAVANTCLTYRPLTQRKWNSAENWLKASPFSAQGVRSIRASTTGRHRPPGSTRSATVLRNRTSGRLTWATDRMCPPFPGLPALPRRLPALGWPSSCPAPAASRQVSSLPANGQKKTKTFTMGCFAAPTSA